MTLTLTSHITFVSPIMRLTCAPMPVEVKREDYITHTIGYDHIKYMLRMHVAMTYVLLVCCILYLVKAVKAVAETGKQRRDRRDRGC